MMTVSNSSPTSMDGSAMRTASVSAKRRSRRPRARASSSVASSVPDSGASSSSNDGGSVSHPGCLQAANSANPRLPRTGASSACASRQRAASTSAPAKGGSAKSDSPLSASTTPMPVCSAKSSKRHQWFECVR